MQKIYVENKSTAVSNGMIATHSIQNGPVGLGYNPDCLIKKKEVLRILGISNSTLYNRMSPKSRYYQVWFPKSIKMGARSVRWSEQEVYQYLNNMKANRYSQKYCPNPLIQ